MTDQSPLLAPVVAELYGAIRYDYMGHDELKQTAIMMSSSGNIFRVTGHLCGEFIGLRWIPCTKASDAEI